MLQRVFSIQIFANRYRPNFRKYSKYYYTNTITIQCKQSKVKLWAHSEFREFQFIFDIGRSTIYEIYFGTLHKKIVNQVR